MDPRLARMDQDLRGPPQTQTTPVTAPPIISATTDPRGPTAFNITDKLVHHIHIYVFLIELNINNIFKYILFFAAVFL